MTTKMSPHGNRDDGYILLDILIALLIVSIGFGAVFGALTTAINYTVKRDLLFTKSSAIRNEETDAFETQIEFK